MPQWKEVEPSFQSDASFARLEKGDYVQGWLLGTREVKGTQRYVVLTDDGRKLILPDHGALHARLRGLAAPCYVRVENRGKVRFQSGRTGYDYRVLVDDSMRPTAEVAAAVEGEAPPF